MPFAVIGFDRGRHSTKACLLVNHEEHHYIAPSLAVPEPSGADPDGDPNERLTVMGRHYLVGNRALATSPDAVFRTTGSKSEGQAATEFQLSFMAVLAWAASKVGIETYPLRVVTSAPDSEYDSAKAGLRELLADSFRFQTGAGKFIEVDVQPYQVQVARESVAPLWAYILDRQGQYTEHPLLWATGGRPGQEEAIKSRSLVVGLGFRDRNVATVYGGARQESRSGVRGVSEIYSALWDRLRSPDINCNLRTRADVDRVLNGSHPVWSHKNPKVLEDAIRGVIRSKGAELLNETYQWAGSPDEYHAILAAGGGCLMLKELVQMAFPNAVFAAQGDSARGLAYAGMRSLNTTTAN